MKTIGILGGVGPETTSKIYHSIIDAFKKNKFETYPSIVIYNLPFPFSIEDDVIIGGINSQRMLPYLIKGAEILQKAGADFGILPCNTLHKYIDEIRDSSSLLFLSILDEAILELVSMKIKTVGILATETTVNDKLYNRILENNGIDFIYPTKIQQKRLNGIILGLINNKMNKNREGEIEKICSDLEKKGADAILLACTDLQAAEFSAQIPIVDTTEILIRASIRELVCKP